MTGMTIAQKQTLLNEYIAAEKAVLRGQAYSIKDRSLTRADLRWIKDGRRQLEEEIAQMSAEGGVQAKRILFRDGI